MPWKPWYAGRMTEHGKMLVGLLLIACGGRAEASNSSPAAGSGGDSPAAQGGAAGSPSSHADGGSVPLGDGDRGPAAPATIPASSPGAFFWGSDITGWRIGNWFLTSDGTRDVGLSPIDPPRDGSTAARHVSGSESQSGAILWAQLDHPANRSVDLSSYSGLTFWVRLESLSAQLDVVLNQSGAHPSTDASSTPSVSLMVGPTWQEVTLPLDAFKISPRAARSVDFRVVTNGEAFDLWIDDLALLR